MSTLLSVATLLVAVAATTAVADVPTLKLFGKCDKDCQSCSVSNEYNATGECVVQAQTSYKATCGNGTYTLLKYTDILCKEGESKLSKTLACEAQLYRSGKVTVDGKKKVITVLLCNESTEDMCSDTANCDRLVMPTNNDTCQQPTEAPDGVDYSYKGNTTDDSKATLKVYNGKNCEGDAIFSITDSPSACYNTVQYEKAECVLPTTTTLSGVLPLPVVGAALAVLVTMLAL